MIKSEEQLVAVLGLGGCMPAQRASAIDAALKRLSGQVEKIKAAPSLLNRLSILDERLYAIAFTFEDLAGMEQTKPLRSMTSLECLWALRWHKEHDEPDMDDLLRHLLSWAMPEWPDGMAVGNAVHKYWIGGQRELN